jgi:diguanylate cyclase (GGDEF)-like protein
VPDRNEKLVDILDTAAASIGAAPTTPDDDVLDHKPVLLLVDDDQDQVCLLFEMFKNDYTIHTANDGQQALLMCMQLQPDLVLLDNIMPGMSGYTVCQQIKSNALTGHIPVIFISALSEPAEEARCLEAGAVDFIGKPFHTRIVQARVRAHVLLKSQTDTLRSMALFDALTGVANRGHFDTMLKAEWRHCARMGQDLSVIMIDVDFFKLYNDQYGHPAGDACLQAVATALSNGLARSHDTVARYGGEEFVCLLPGTPLAGAIQIAAALERAVRSLKLPHAASAVSSDVTISLGVACTRPDNDIDPQTLIEQADNQLYLAKGSGRARVMPLAPDC